MRLYCISSQYVLSLCCPPIMSFFTLSSHFVLSLFLTILVFFKNLISCVHDPALDTADGTNRGGEDDEDDGEGEQGEEQKLHGEGDAGE